MESDCLLEITFHKQLHLSNAPWILVLGTRVFRENTFTDKITFTDKVYFSMDISFVYLEGLNLTESHKVKLTPC